MPGMKRHPSACDEDYDVSRDPTAQQTKRQKLLEFDAREATKRKIERVIRREFSIEIRKKEEEIELINQKLGLVMLAVVYQCQMCVQRLTLAKKMLDRLRACVVASYYGRVMQSTQSTQSTDAAKPTPIHPAVRKLLGKTVQAADVRSLLAESTVGRGFTQHHTASSFHSRSVKLEQPVTSSASVSSTSSSSSTSLSSEPGHQLKTKKMIVVGNISKYLVGSKKELNDPATHKWMLYVRGSKDEPRIDHFVDKVIFLLHDTYKPNNIVTVTEAPFHLTRRGWGEFPVRVQLHFRDGVTKSIDVIHKLTLDKTYTGAQTMGAETIVEVELDSVIGDVPTLESDNNDYYSRLVAMSAGKLSRTVKSDHVVLNTKQAASSASMSVSCVSSLAQSMPSNVYPTVSVKQELGLSSQHQQSECMSGCQCCRVNWCRAEDDRDLLCEVQVKQEPSSPVSEISAECQLLSLHSELVSAVPSVSIQTTDSELKVETNATDKLTVTDVNCECDNVAATDAHVGAAAAVMSSSESLTSLRESSQLPVSTPAVSLPVCNSLSSSDAVVTNMAVSVPQELVRCRNSFGKMYSIPRSLLLCVQSSQAVNCSNSGTECSLLSTCQSTCVVSVALTRSAGKSDVLPSVCDVAAANTLSSSKSVISVMSNGHVTTCSNVCTARVQPSVVTISLSHSVIQNTTLSSTALTTVTTPLSAQSTSMLSCISCTSISTRTTPSSQRLHQVCLTSDKCGDQVRMTSVPYCTLNSAVIKPRPLVRLCSVNSPARSLPHITVLSSISSVVATSHNVAPVSTVAGSERPTSQMSAKLATSSKSPVYFVIGSNNKVVSGNSHSLMEVILVPATKDVSQRTVCSMRPVAAAGVTDGCINRSTYSSVPSSQHSIICTPLLNRISKSCSNSRVSLLRPHHVASSTAMTKPSLLEPRVQMKRTSSSSGLNIFATKIGNQTVIVDIGSLSSSNSAPVKPAVTALTSVSSMKAKNMFASRSACNQQDPTPVCGNVLLQSSSLCTRDIPSNGATADEVFNCAAVIRMENFECLEDLVRAVVREFPLVKANFDQSQHPYCAPSWQAFLDWNIGKRRAAELCRVVKVRQRILSLLNGAHSLHGEALWSRRRLITWCRANLCTPLDNELCQRLSDTDSTDSTRCRNHYSSLSLLDAAVRPIDSMTSCTPRYDSCDFEINVVDEDDISASVLKTRQGMYSPHKLVDIQHLLPLSVEAQFVRDVIDRVELRRRPVAIDGFPTYFHSAVEETIASVLRLFVSNILQTAAALMYENGRYPLSISADDIHAVLTTSDRFDFLTNKYLGTPKIKEEML